MKENNSGFSTPSMLLLIFSLSIILSGITVLINSVSTRINREKEVFTQKHDAEEVLNAILDDFQKLKEDECDSEKSIGKRNLLEKYSAYNLVMNDCSTGINLNFLSKKYAESSVLERFLEINPERVVKYGWIYEFNSDKELINQILQDFNEEKINELNPLVSKIAPLNIYEMDQNFLEVIFAINKVADFKDKAELLIEKMKQEDIKSSSIPSIIGVNPSHPVVNWLGVKTVLWKSSFNTEKMDVNAVIAGIAGDKNPTLIDKYILIESECNKRRNI